MVSQGLANDDFSPIFHRLLQEGGPPRIRQQVVGTKGRRRIEKRRDVRWFGAWKKGDFPGKIWVIFRKKLLYFTKKLINYAKYSLNIPENYWSLQWLSTIQPF